MSGWRIWLVGAGMAGGLALGVSAGTLEVDDLHVFRNLVVADEVTRGGVPREGLVLMCDFDDPAGVVGDVSGTLLPGTVCHVHWIPDGRIAGACRFNGLGADTASRIEFADAPAIDIRGALTLSAWIRPVATKGITFCGIIGKYRHEGINTKERSYVLQYHPKTRKVRLSISGDGTKVVTVDSDVALTLGTWTHIAGTYEPGARMRLYINGTPDSERTKSVPTAIHSAPAPLWIGQMGSTTWKSFPGDLDSCQVFARALPAVEIRELHAYTGTNFPPSSARFASGVSYLHPLGDISMGIYTNGR